MFHLTQDRNRRLWWADEATQSPVEVHTVSRAARLLRRSRRQIYRCIQNGMLVAVGKVLGEWLLSASSVEHLRSNPPTRQPVPRRFGTLFAEYDVDDLNAGKDRVIVITRLLDTGDRRSLRWLFRRFRVREVRDVVISDGSRLLSPRSLNLWSVFFRLKPTAQRRATQDMWGSRALA